MTPRKTETVPIHGFYDCTGEEFLFIPGAADVVWALLGGRPQPQPEGDDE